LQEDSRESDEHPSLATATLKGVFWMTATRGLKAPLSLIAVAILARILTPADFGIIALGMVVASFSDMLVDGSFSLVLIQRREIDSRIIGGTFALSAGLATFFAAGVILSAPYIERDFNFTHLRDVLIFFATILPITAITTVTTALLQRRLQFRVLTVNAFCSQLAYSVSSVALAVAGMGVWSLVWAQMLQSSIDAALGFLAVRKRYRIKLSVSGIREVLGSGGVFTASKILKWAANSVDRVIIGRMLGAAELGFYTRSTTLMGTARQLAGAGPTRVLFSSFAKMQNDSERLRRAYTRALSVTANPSQGGVNSLNPSSAILTRFQQQLRTITRSGDPKSLLEPLGHATVMATCSAAVFAEAVSSVTTAGASTRRAARHLNGPMNAMTAHVDVGIRPTYDGRPHPRDGWPT
jgi:PST family polysaccharide transporter